MQTDSFTEFQHEKTEEEFDLDAFLQEYLTPEVAQEPVAAAPDETEEMATVETIADKPQGESMPAQFSLDALLAEYRAQGEDGDASTGSLPQMETTEEAAVALPPEFANQTDANETFETPLLPETQETQELAELPQALPFAGVQIEEAQPENNPQPPQSETGSPFFNDIEFDLQFRGYNRAQVDDYIDALTADYNAICRTCEELTAENKGLRRALAKLEGLTGETLDEEIGEEPNAAFLAESEPEQPMPHPTNLGNSALLANHFEETTREEQAEIPEASQADLDVDLLFNDDFSIGFIFNEAMDSTEFEPLPTPELTLFPQLDFLEQYAETNVQFDVEIDAEPLEEQPEKATSLLPEAQPMTKVVFKAEPPKTEVEAIFHVTPAEVSP